MPENESRICQYVTPHFGAQSCARLYALALSAQTSCQLQDAATPVLHAQCFDFNYDCNLLCDATSTAIVVIVMPNHSTFAIITCQLILVLHFYGPGISANTHLGDVLGSNLKRKSICLRLPCGFACADMQSSYVGLVSMLVFAQPDHMGVFHYVADCLDSVKFWT